MTCQEFKTAYFAEEKVGSAAAHLESCAACRDLLATYEAGLSYLRASVEVSPPPYLSPKIVHRLQAEASRRRRRVRLRLGVATVCAALLVGALIYWNGTGPVTNLGTKTQEHLASVPQAPAAELPAPVENQAAPPDTSARTQEPAAEEPGPQVDLDARVPRKTVARRPGRWASDKPRHVAATAAPPAKPMAVSPATAAPSSAEPRFWFVRVDLQSPAGDVRVRVLPGKGHELLALGGAAGGEQEYHFVEPGTYLVPLRSVAAQEPVTVEVERGDERSVLRVRPPQTNPAAARDALSAGDSDPVGDEAAVIEGNVLAFLPGEGKDLHAAQGVTVGRGVLEPRPITVANLKRVPNLAGKVELVMADARVDLSEFQVLPAR